MASLSVVHHGSCHCRAVRFECDAPKDVVAWDCNCSICHLKRNTHFMVPAENFRLISGQDNLTCYQFNTGVAKHLFCKTCGVCSFYRPRSNPDCYAVTVYCIKPGTLGNVEVRMFDGQHWEEAYGSTGIANIAKK